MTSAEFAAKYRVMKTLSDAGVRSQIAQEVALGRMVLVHTLDALPPAERQALIARLDALPPDAAAKVFGRFDVDGAVVVVTHFFSNFTTLPAWLDSVGGTPPDDIQNAATVVMAAPVVPKPSAPPPSSPAFTSPTPTPPARPSRSAPAMTAPQASAPPQQPAPQKGASFTSIFGAAASSEKSTAPATTPEPTPAPPASRSPTA